MRQNLFLWIGSLKLHLNNFVAIRNFVFCFVLLLLQGLNLAWGNFEGRVQLVLAMLALSQSFAEPVEQFGNLSEAITSILVTMLSTSIMIAKAMFHS